MIRAALPVDRKAIMRFLERHHATSMHLAGAVSDHGIGRNASMHSVDIWICESEGGITAVFAVSGAGFLLCAFDQFDTNWVSGLREAMRGQRVISASGEADQIDTLLSALAIPKTAFALDELEPLSTIKLGDLVIPDGDTQLRLMEPQDLDLIADWRSAFDREIFGDDVIWTR